jgi:hypothetical protein
MRAGEIATVALFSLAATITSNVVTSRLQRRGVRFASWYVALFWIVMILILMAIWNWEIRSITP